VGNCYGSVGASTKLTYDPKHNVAYFRFHEKTEEVPTLKVSEKLNIDIAPDGTIYVIELINANEQRAGQEWEIRVSCHLLLATRYMLLR